MRLFSILQRNFGEDGAVGTDALSGSTKDFVVLDVVEAFLVVGKKYEMQPKRYEQGGCAFVLRGFATFVHKPVICEQVVETLEDLVRSLGFFLLTLFQVHPVPKRSEHGGGIYLLGSLTAFAFDAAVAGFGFLLKGHNLKGKI